MNGIAPAQSDSGIMTPQIVFQCMYCRIKLQVPIFYAGQVGPCPQCGHTIQTPVAFVAPPAPSATVPPSADAKNVAGQAAADPNNPASLIDIVSVQLLLGKIYFEQQNYPEALNTYKQAQQMDVNDFRPILATAIVLKEQGKNQEAQPLFQEALSRAPFAYREEIQSLIRSQEIGVRR